jgi:hypothetical protein
MRATRSWIGAMALAAVVANGAAPASAEEALSAAGSMKDALEKLGAGRAVEVVLEGGKSYRGKLGMVGDDTVLVTELAGKEFYDVLIDLDAIAAVEVRTRGN